MIKATSGLKGFAIITAVLGLLSLPFVVTRCLRMPFAIIDYGETVAVPRYMKNATLAVAFSLDDDDSRIIVSLPKEADTYLGNRSLRNTELLDGIRKRMQRRPARERVVYLQAAVDVSYGSLIDVLKTIRAAGIDRVGLVVKKQSAPDGKVQGGFLEVRLPKPL